ncbi:MAG TPA: hypothetical protein VI540_04790, partial [Gaiellaceae bacterium]|nr:hypothetical protein [Gaiellaceae bacterium]
MLARCSLWPELAGACTHHERLDASGYHRGVTAAVLSNLVDFGERRPELWPAIDASVYRVHTVGEDWAEVTEGSDVFAGIWARERYDWSSPGVVQATIQDSNVWHPGATWTLLAEPGRNGGSRLAVVRERPSSARRRRSASSRAGARKDGRAPA